MDGICGVTIGVRQLRECFNLKKKKTVEHLQELINAVRCDDMEALKAIGAVPSLGDLQQLVANCRSTKEMQRQLEDSCLKLNVPITG